MKRLGQALCAFFVVAISLTACGGGGIPGDAVVTVGQSTIKKSTFQHWIRVAAISTAGQSDPTAAASGKTPVVHIPVPPDFTDCIANKKKTAAKPAKGQPEQSPAQFKAACKTEYAGLRDQVLQFLISSEWINSEASDQGVKVTDKQVLTKFKATKKQSYPEDAAFQKFLKSSGYTVNDLLFQVRNDLIGTKLRAKIVKGKATVTPAQISTYYNKNKARFSQPERRDLRIILTKTQAQAAAALKQIKGGASFGKVAKKVSIDQSSKSQGGVLLGIAKGQQEKALDTAVFAAKKGALTGPVKTQFGYYIFKVQKITKATTQSLAAASPTIKTQLATENQQTALNKFVTSFRKKWKAKTDCRKGFVTTDCKNAPKKKAASTTTGTGTTTPVPTTTTPDTTTTTP